ncbi:MAG: tetratricopeptide repeat protein [Deltaproteobacteria bacterium]|jgi:tetratricopeptide (TPR) repeat protein|nr:tetratricopeptide repeat protein [Deltaproteobacteria bacterium]
MLSKLLKYPIFYFIFPILLVVIFLATRDKDKRFAPEIEHQIKLLIEQAWENTAHKDFNLAVEKYRKAIQLSESHMPDKKNPALYYNLANALFSDGKYGEALGYFQMALKLQPYFPQARKNLELARETARQKARNKQLFNSAATKYDKFLLTSYFNSLILFIQLVVFFCVFWLLAIMRIYQRGKGIKYLQYVILLWVVILALNVFGLTKDRFGNYSLNFSAVTNLADILAGKSNLSCVTIKSKVNVYANWDDKTSQVIMLLDEGVELLQESDHVPQKQTHNVAIQLPNSQIAWIAPADLFCH